MSTASLENITFDTITSNNSSTYNTNKYAGLLIGNINLNSLTGTSLINNIIISNSNFIYNTTTVGRVGLIAGIVKNATVSDVTLTNNRVEYRSTYTAQEHWSVGFMFGLNGGNVTIENISGSSNNLYQNQGNHSTNAPGAVIGYASAKAAQGTYLELNDFLLSVNIYLKTTGTRSSWRFGYYGDLNTSELVSSNLSITTNILNITSY